MDWCRNQFGKNQICQREPRRGGCQARQVLHALHHIPDVSGRRDPVKGTYLDLVAQSIPY